MPKARILVVQDGASAPDRVQRTLRALGYDVAAHLDSTERLGERAAALSPDAILMDLKTGNGEDPLHAVEELGSRVKAPLILAIPGADQGLIKRARQTHPRVEVIKTLEDGELEAVLLKVLRREEVSPAPSVTVRVPAIQVPVRRQVDTPAAARPETNGYAGFAMCDVTGHRPGAARILEVNAGFERLMGIRAEEACGKRLQEVLDHVDDRLAEMVERVARTGEPGAVDILSPSRSGRLHVSACRPAPDRLGLMVEDTREREWAEQARVQTLEPVGLPTELGQRGTWEWRSSGHGAPGEWTWSDEVYAILGVRPGDVRPSRDGLSRFVCPDDRAAFEQALDDVLRGPQPLTLDVRCNRPGGEIRHVQVRAQVFRAPDGKPLRLVGSLMDLTEVRRAQREARARERIGEIFLMAPDQAVFGALLDVALEALESKHGALGYVDANGEFVSPAMSPGFWGSNHPNRGPVVFPREQWGSQWGRALMTGATLISNQPLTFAPGQQPIRRALSVPIGQSGRIMGLIHVANKDTDYVDRDQQLLQSLAATMAPLLHDRLRRMWAEAKQQQGEAQRASGHGKLTALLSNLPGMVYQCPSATSWSLDFVSQGALELTGHKAEELVNDSKVAYKDLIHPEDRDSAWRAIQDALAVKQPYQILYRIRPATGGERLVCDQGRGVYSPAGQPSGFEGAVVPYPENRRTGDAGSSQDGLHHALLARFPVGLFRARVPPSGPAVLEDVNPRFCEMMELDKSILLRDTARALAAQRREDLDQLVRSVEALRSNPQRQAWDVRATVAGVPRWFRVQVSQSVKKADGMVVDGALTDITERKRAEEAQREAEQRFRTLGDFSPDWEVVEAPDGWFLYVSMSCQDLTGCTPEELAANPNLITELIVPEDREAYAAHCREHHGHKGQRSSLEFRVQSKHGVVRWIEHHCQPVTSKDGTYLGHRSSNRDISVHKQVTDVLQEFKEREQRLVENLGSRLLVFECSTTGVITHISSTAKSMLGLEPAEAVGRPWVELTRWKPDCINPGWDAMAWILAGKPSSTMEMTHRHRDGTEHQLRITFHPVRDGQGVIRSVQAIAADLTVTQHAERTLRKNQERLALVVEAFNLSTWEWLVDDDQLNVDDKWHQLVGPALDPDNFNLTSWLHAMHPEDRDEARTTIQALLDGKKAQIHLHFRMQRPGRSPTWMSCTLRIDERGPADGAARVFGVFQEITEHKRAVEDVRQAQQRVVDIVDGMPDPAFVVDESRRVVAWNRAMEELTGVKKADICGKGDLEYAVPFYGEPRPLLVDYWFMSEAEFGQWFDTVDRKRNTVTSEGYAPILFGGGGAYLWMASSPMLDESGRVVGALEIVRDISGQKQAEQALQLAHANLVEIIENSEDTIWSLDKNYRLLVANSRFRLDRGVNLVDVVPETMRPMWRERYDRALAGERFTVEDQLEHPDGPAFVETTFFPIRVDDEVASVTCFARDITERKRNELRLELALQEADDAYRTKSAFLATMSHEIRNPLNAIMGLTHLARQGNLTPRQKNHLTRIDSSAHGLLGVMNDILDFSEMEAGKLVMERASFELEEVLEKVAHAVSSKASDKNVELAFDLAADVPTALTGDARRLGQVLIKLADNGVKFTPAGSVLVSVGVVGKEEGRVSLRFSVTDTGIGMAPEQVDGLFDTLSLADASATSKDGGTGLGLAFCRQLIHMMGGEVGVSSELGKGSTFWFTAVFEGEWHERTWELPEQLKGARVLAVAQSRVVLQTLQDLLGAMGLSVAVASSLDLALELDRDARARQEPFKLVLLDKKIGTTPFHELARRLKEDAGGQNEPVVIVMTSAMGLEGVKNADRPEVAAWVSKPIGPSRLWAAILAGFGIPAITRWHESDWRSAATGATSPFKGKRVLLVDDNAPSYEVTREWLTSHGMNVTVVNHGADAVAAVAQGGFDIVLMELKLPVMDGLSAAHKIRELPGEVARVPIIALTARAMSGVKDEARAVGMNDHLTKPVDPEELLSTLWKWIKPGVKELPPPPEKPALAEDIPEIRGLDTAAGLRRTDGNLTLYHGLLERFGTLHGRAVAEIRQALGAGKRQEAERRAQELKVAAGNLGASWVQEAAVRVEKCIHNGRTNELEHLLKRLEQELRWLTEELASPPKRDEPPPPVQEEAPMETVDLQEEATAIGEALNRVAAHLNASDLRARESFQELKRLVGPSASLDRTFKALEGHLRYLHFRAARSTLAQLSKELGLTAGASHEEEDA